MSFPSGHSSAAFAGFGFLALYLNAKFKMLPYHTSPTDNAHEKTENGSVAKRTPHWKLVLWVLPWLVALLIAASKIRDGWHHPVDVLFGAMVGTVFAHVAFWCVFRGVYDGRVNHLQRG
ncbi:hypothetical protein M3J09_007736 [Ascochyta lentis]